jgi:hypothetical protein
MSTSGVAAVELALILPVLLLIICGIADFGNLYYQQHLASEAAREGARLISVSQNLKTAASDATTLIQNKYDSQFQVQVSPLLPSSGNTVTVKVSKSVAIITPIISSIFSGNTYSVIESCVMRVE